jgi:hypothetical protein
MSRRTRARIRRGWKTAHSATPCSGVPRQEDHPTHSETAMQASRALRNKTVRVHMRSGEVTIIRR